MRERGIGKCNETGDGTYMKYDFGIAAGQVPAKSCVLGTSDIGCQNIDGSGFLIAGRR